MTENMPEPLKSAVKGVQNMFTGPQRTMEELSSGVEDGLSRCTSEPWTLPVASRRRLPSFAYERKEHVSLMLNPRLRPCSCDAQIV